MKVLLLLLSLALLSIQADEIPPFGQLVGECPIGWLPKQGFCYLASEDALTFHEAAAYCNETGSNLVQITSQEKQDIIADALKTLKKDHTFLSTSDYLWIGGSSEREVSKWEWIPSLAPIVYTNWARDEPDNVAWERCLVIQGNPENKWDDCSCSGKYRFICERITTSAAQQANSETQEDSTTHYSTTEDSTTQYSTTEDSTTQYPTTEDSTTQYSTKEADTVAFTAVFDSDRDIEGGQTLIFNKVLLNSGSGYDNTTGIFTAPSGGIYVFHINGLTKWKKQLWIELIHNQEYVVSAFARQGSDFDAAGNSVTQRLEKNDTVYVRAHQNSFFFSRPKVIYTTFSGYRIGL